jgi:hypothetical protein
LNAKRGLLSECKAAWTANSSFEIVDRFKYLGTNPTNQNPIQEEFKNSLKSGNACYHSVQNLLSSSMPYKHFNIKVLRTII